MIVIDLRLSRRGILANPLTPELLEVLLDNIFITGDVWCITDGIGPPVAGVGEGRELMVMGIGCGGSCGCCGGWNGG